MDDDIKSIISNLGLVTQLGLVVVLCLVIGLFCGYLADKWTQHGSIFKMLGIILGLGAGLWQAYRLIMEKIK